MNVVMTRGSLVAEVLAALEAAADPSRSLVVFPGKRPAHVLRKAMARTIGSSFLPPVIHSAESFAAFLGEEWIARRRRLEPFDAAALLHAIHARIPHGAGEGRYPSLEAFLPVGLEIFAELEEVHIAALDPAEIRARLGGIASPSLHALADYAAAFYREADARGYWTRSMLYRAVAAAAGGIDLARFDRVILAGLAALAPAEAAIVRSLSARPNVLLILEEGPGLRERMRRAQIDLPEPAPAPPAPPPNMRFYRSSDGHGQVFALAARLRERPVPDERTAVVLPSPDALFPVIHHALAALPDDRYNISLGYPLARTPVFGFVSGLLDLAVACRNGKFPVPAYLRFVLHPYTKNIRWGARADVTRILFHALEEICGASGTKALLSLTAIEEDPVLFETAAVRAGAGDDGRAVTAEELRAHCRAIHDATIRKILEPGTIGAFASRLVEILQYIYNESTARRHPYFRPYVERMIALLAAVPGSIIGAERFASVSGYVTFLRDITAGESVPFPGTPLQGLQVLGLLETRSLAFETVYMLDVNDDVLPGGAGATHLLLPEPVRVLLGLETAADRELLAEYHFDLLVRGAKEVHLFYAAGGKKERSRFIEKIFWRREREERRLVRSGLEEAVSYRVKLSNDRPGRIAKTPAMMEVLHNRVRLSATNLDTYLGCQLRFYYQSVLGLREKAEVTGEIDASDIGSLVHAILGDFFRPFIGTTLKPELLRRDDLDAAVDGRFRAAYGDDPDGAALLMKAQVRRQLWEFLENYQSTAPPATITALEKEVEVRLRGYRFAGRIDRVETRGQTVAILDYKTKHDARDIGVRIRKLDVADRSTWAAAVRSFQLPLYMMLQSASGGLAPERIRPAYLMLGKTPIDPSIEAPLGGEEEIPPDAVYRAVEPVIFGLAAEIHNIEVPFAPPADLERQCPRCPFTAICGTQHVKGGKR